MTKRWLFVTYCSDPKRPFLEGAVRYRCFDRAEDLRAEGAQAAVMSQQRFMRRPPLDFDHYVFHRPWHTQDFEGMLAYLARRGKRLFGDYDAPVFDEPWRGPVPPPFPELPASGVPSQQRFDRALRLFDTILAATTPLAEIIHGRCPDSAVHVIESGLSSSWREMADALYRYPPDERTHVCAGAGTEVELDPELVGRILPPVMEARPDLRVFVDSPLRAGVSLPPGRTSERPYEAGCHEILGKSHTLILPAAPNLWNQAASGVRALEAAYLGCRVIASPLPSMQGHQDGGIQLAGSEREWIELLQGSEPERDEATLIRMCEYAKIHGASARHTRRMIEVCEN